MIYVGHADDLSAERLPVQPPGGARAGSGGRATGTRLAICTYEVPGGLRSHREQIAQELVAIYRPSCNEQQYDRAWKDEWIGEYTRRRPARSPPAVTPA